MPKARKDSRVGPTTVPAPLADRDRGDEYIDLVAAVLRGAISGDGRLDPPCPRDVYLVERDNWAHMRSDLLMQVVTDVGSIRKASTILDVPRSTLGGWVLRRRRFWAD